ncbi:UTP--glucose-1-phosphate uridylyltransferase [Strigomonas culicis]|uniref:UTP--glucose-1-phosphate uridylyltransferase n=1 Tax=Strigomonas culicis TaxID=28005 RepID=S9V859_9TRYP|nr:UTP--glucose-1-phosphate uridylyltransferase [Strigomonas culicis]|eukprot:EPY37244.1 UTP--glucose-1-phosphate uridylyltransferase [Strigomonas culicis]
MPAITALPPSVDLAALRPSLKTSVVKMQNAGVSVSCILSFIQQYNLIAGGSTGIIAESDIEPVLDVPTLDALSPSRDAAQAAALLQKTVMLKLNGGLGTGMGLHDAKSLLPVRQSVSHSPKKTAKTTSKNFLDFIIQQVLYFRENGSPHLRFMLMDSFSTSDSTRAYLEEHYGIASLFKDPLPPVDGAPAAGRDYFTEEVELLQNQVPKIRQDTLEPAEWPADSKCEWAPPGHGDLYTALYGSGKLAALLAAGYEYLFVSNGDNLGATLDERIVSHMRDQKIDFLMEVCERTESDRKGGHLARQRQRDSRLLLRESAQCAREDEASFQDITKYKYFNTNNLWIHLPALQAQLEQHDGALPLPVIRNEKTVDPSNKKSYKVYQLETAMGAAIAHFDSAAALVVPRTRFAPVKTCGDLLALRSDAYIETADARLILAPARHGKPPTIQLDNDYYKFISGFEQLIEGGVPSLIGCNALAVKGPVRFEAGVVIKGKVRIENTDTEKVKVIEKGRVLDNETI